MQLGLICLLAALARFLQLRLKFLLVRRSGFLATVAGAQLVKQRPFARRGGFGCGFGSLDLLGLYLVQLAIAAVDHDDDRVAIRPHVVECILLERHDYATIRGIATTERHSFHRAQHAVADELRLAQSRHARAGDVDDQAGWPVQAKRRERRRQAAAQGNHCSLRRFLDVQADQRLAGNLALGRRTSLRGPQRLHGQAGGQYQHEAHRGAKQPESTHRSLLPSGDDNFRLEPLCRELL